MPLGLLQELLKKKKSMSLCKMFNLSLIFICELWMIHLFVEGDCHQKMRVGELIHLKRVVHLNLQSGAPFGSPVCL